MTTKINPAFRLDGINLPIDRILPMKQVATDETKNSTLRRIMSSIKVVGLIEPLIVFPQGSGKAANYSLLDGHIRLEAMRKLGFTKISCLISTEDEAYTYNHKVNVVPPIQEHFMIMKAISDGVSEERIAAALSVDVGKIREKRDLLNGICEEAVEMLKHKTPSREALREMRKVKPMRQMEMAELMIRSNAFTAGYAKCLLAATSDDQLVDPQKPKTPKGLNCDDIAGMEREMESLEQNFLALADTHGKTVLDLTLATTYLRRLMDNAAVTKFLATRYSHIHAEFVKLIETTSLDRGA